MVSRFEQFSLAITKINRNLKRIESTTMEKYGLRGHSAIYLITLYKYAEGLTSARLAELCERNKSEVSRELSSLEAVGLVKRICDSGKSYRAPVVLTDSGKEAAEKLAELATTATGIVSNGIPEQSIELFHSIMAMISDNLERVCESGIPDTED